MDISRNLIFGVRIVYTSTMSSPVVEGVNVADQPYARFGHPKFKTLEMRLNDCFRNYLFLS